MAKEFLLIIRFITIENS